MDVLQSILAKHTTEALARVITIAWGLWFRRNKLVFEATHLYPVEAMNYALSLQIEYKDA